MTWPNASPYDPYGPCDGYGMLSRSFTAVHTVPSGATARPSPLRTPRSTTRGSVPVGLTAMITARCGSAWALRGKQMLAV
jgi:hypothetical protein